MEHNINQKIFKKMENQEVAVTAKEIKVSKHYRFVNILETADDKFIVIVGKCRAEEEFTSEKDANEWILNNQKKVLEMAFAEIMINIINIKEEIKNGKGKRN